MKSVRLGQKTEKFFETKVEYYAPYLLKDGMVQRMTQYENNSEDAEEIQTFVKYKNRADKLIGKVVEKQENKLTEKFDLGRPDRLEELIYINQGGEQIKIYKFYHRSRKDGLYTRESRDWGNRVRIFIEDYHSYTRDQGHLHQQRRLLDINRCQFWDPR